MRERSIKLYSLFQTLRANRLLILLIDQLVDVVILLDNMYSMTTYIYLGVS